MWLQKRLLKTGLGKCCVVSMALCAISLAIRSEATEHHPAVLTVFTGPPVAPHHNRGANSISRARGHLGVMSTDSSRSAQRPPGHTRSSLLTPRLVRAPHHICAQMYAVWSPTSPGSFPLLSGHISILSGQKLILRRR